MFYANKGIQLSDFVSLNIAALIHIRQLLPISDPKQGIDFLQVGVAKGNPDSMVLLSKCYFSGRYVEVDIEKAKKLQQMYIEYTARMQEAVGVVIPRGGVAAEVHENNLNMDKNHKEMVFGHKEYYGTDLTKKMAKPAEIKEKRDAKEKKEAKQKIDKDIEAKGKEFKEKEYKSMLKKKLFNKGKKLTNKDYEQM